MSGTNTNDWAPHIGQQVRFAKSGSVLSGAVGYVHATRLPGLCQYGVVFPAHRLSVPVGLAEIEPV